MKRISVLGAGAWGTALALLLKENGHEPVLWFYDKDALTQAEEEGTNPYLGGVDVSSLSMTSGIEEAVSGSDIVLLTTPAQHLRGVLKEAEPFLDSGQVLVNCAKGIEIDSFKLMHQVANEVAPDNRYAVLSGPSFAAEVARQKETIVVIASSDKQVAEELLGVFRASWFRPYVSEDVLGVEIGGSFKNIIAIAAGVIVGMDKGENLQAALITRGLNQIKELSAVYGAKPETLFGAAGLGDLILTATSGQSRNFKFGLEIGQGRKPADILDSSPTVEGYYSTEAALRMAADKDLNLSVVEELYQVLYKQKSPEEAVKDIMNGNSKEES